MREYNSNFAEFLKELQNKFFMNTPLDTNPNNIQERYLYSIYQAGYEDACKDLMTENSKNREE